MAKKVTKKQTAKSRATKNTKTKKATKNETTENSSLSIMILAIVGIVLLIYFGTSSELSVDVKVNTSNSQEQIQKSEITISGKTYSSSDEAYNLLKEIPQTRLTDEETSFVESYKVESYQ